MESFLIYTHSHPCRTKGPAAREYLNVLCDTQKYDAVKDEKERPTYNKTQEG